MATKTLRSTASVCPICLKRIPATLVQKGSEIFLEKSCPEHGDFSTVTWRGVPELLTWTGQRPEMPSGEAPACPWACGICPDHKQSTCCILLEITSRCNLRCSFCFAEAGEGENDSARNGEISRNTPADPPLEQVKEWISDIASTGDAFLQLSGGEPTVRDDLPEIVRHAKEAGCAYIQLNSNGLRLADDESLVAELAEAGLSFVFLQFDGLNDNIYKKLRGAALLDKKLRAIENCARYNIGVTLVPTVVPGVNDDDIGNIVEFAVKNSPKVRGVHFQPVSYFGRYPEAPDNAQRITLPEVLTKIYEQAGDTVPAGSISPSRCDHARCGFHGAYLAMPEGLVAQAPKKGSCCDKPLPAENNRHFVGLRWQRKGSDGLASASAETSLPGAVPVSIKSETGCCGESSGSAQSPGKIAESCCGELPLAAQAPTSCCSEEQTQLPLAASKNSCCEPTQIADSCCAPAEQSCCDTATPLTIQSECCSGSAESSQNAQSFSSLDDFLQLHRNHAFTISAMAFQDAYTLDLERLRQCSLHVYAQGALVPFCAYYLNDAKDKRQFKRYRPK